MEVNHQNWFRLSVIRQQSSKLMSEMVLTHKISKNDTDRRLISQSRLGATLQVPLDPTSKWADPLKWSCKAIQLELISIATSSLGLPHVAHLSSRWSSQRLSIALGKKKSLQAFSMRHQVSRDYPRLEDMRPIRNPSQQMGQIRATVTSS